MVLLVTGSGRSGTSSLAGSLKRLGLHVPQPEVPAMPSNPKGFYEPRWVIAFHRRRLASLAVHNIDARPRAAFLVEELLADESARDQLRRWLGKQLDDAPLVIKDPHAFWFLSLWKDVARELGIDLRLLTALRHPAEVVGSRDIAYGSRRTETMRQVKETSNVAGWINAALLTEQAGRHIPRAFIRYPDLVSDWRTALGRVGDQLELHFDADLTSRRHHEVDDFIDVGLRRSRLTWGDLNVPGPLRDMGEEVWQLVSGLVERPGDASAMQRLDQLREEYDHMFDEAVALSFDHTKAEVKRKVRKVAAKRDKRIARLRRRVARQHERIAALEQRRQWRTRIRALLR